MKKQVISRCIPTAVLMWSLRQIRRSWTCITWLQLHLQSVVCKNGTLWRCCCTVEIQYYVELVTNINLTPQLYVGARWFFLHIFRSYVGWLEFPARSFTLTVTLILNQFRAGDILIILIWNHFCLWSFPTLIIGNMLVATWDLHFWSTVYFVRSLWRVIWRINQRYIVYHNRWE